VEQVLEVQVELVDGELADPTLAEDRA